MMASRMMTILLIVFMGQMSFAADAPKQPQAQPQSQAKKKTTINFEDQLVSGELKKPELFYLLQKKQFNFGRLIKLRENFVPEMRKTAEEIQRGGD
jgi:hypothetical protein